MRNPAVLGEVKHLLGLPDTVEALHQMEETLSHMDRRIYRLTEAQARTDQTVDRLGQKVDRLVEAQARTEATLERFMEKTDRGMAELRDAQARTDATLERFMEKTDRGMAELRDAQTRTEKGVAELRDAQTRTVQIDWRCKGEGVRPRGDFGDRRSLIRLGGGLSAFVVHDRCHDLFEHFAPPHALSLALRAPVFDSQKFLCHLFELIIGHVHSCQVCGV